MDSHTLRLAAMVDSKTAKSARARRFLKNREAKLNENPKTALLVRGQKTSGLINNVLIDLFMLKKPHGRASPSPKMPAPAYSPASFAVHLRRTGNCGRRSLEAAQRCAPF